jgi:hypothetical protein
MKRFLSELVVRIMKGRTEAVLKKVLTAIIVLSVIGIISQVPSGFAATNGLLNVEARYWTGSAWSNIKVSVSVHQVVNSTPCTYVVPLWVNWSITVPKTYSGSAFTSWSDGSTSVPKYFVLTPTAPSLSVTANYGSGTPDPPPQSNGGLLSVQARLWSGTAWSDISVRVSVHGDVDYTPCVYSVPFWVSWSITLPNTYNGKAFTSWSDGSTSVPKYFVLTPTAPSLSVTANYGSGTPDPPEPPTQNLIIRRYAIFDYAGWSGSPASYVKYSDMMQTHYDGPSPSNFHTIRTNYSVLVYRNVRAIYSGSTEYSTFVNNKWILKDKYGNYVKLGSGQYIVDIGSPGYQQWVANWIANYVKTRGYDGAMLDNAMYVLEGNWHYGLSGEPMNPRHSPLSPFTSAEVIAAHNAIYDAVKVKLGSNKTVVANGIHSGGKYFTFDTAGYNSLISHLDGFMSEGWLSNWEQAIPYYTEKRSGNSQYNWVDSVNMVQQINSQFTGKSLIMCALCADNCPWGASSPLTTTAQKQQYCLFNYASMLLGASTKNYNYLDLGWWGNQNMVYLWNLNLGTPKANYYQDSNGNYVRQFTNGVVTVNPGTSVRGSMQPHTATIKTYS